MYALTNCRIYTGFEILDKHVVIIDGDKIVQVCPKSEMPRNMDVEDLKCEI